MLHCLLLRLALLESLKGLELLSVPQVCWQHADGVGAARSRQYLPGSSSEGRLGVAHETALKHGVVLAVRGDSLGKSCGRGGRAGEASAPERILRHRCFQILSLI